MFLYQKLKYKVTFVYDKEGIDKMVDNFYMDKEKLEYIGFDTETNGLDEIASHPFLKVIGWLKNIYVCDLESDIAKDFVDAFIQISKESPYVFAHNCNYDVHMVLNYGVDIETLRDINFADSGAVFRFTEYSDEIGHKKSDRQQPKDLEYIGQKYISNTSKFASKAIKKKIEQINAQRKKELKVLYDKTFNRKKDYTLSKANRLIQRMTFSRAFELHKGEVPFVDTYEPEYEEYVSFVRRNWKPANYRDVYEKEPELMIRYAVDDVVIMLEYLKLAFPKLKEIYDNDLHVFQYECDIILESVEEQRRGVLLDILYLIESRDNLNEFKNRLYEELYELLGERDFSVSATQRIAKIMERKYFVKIPLTAKGNSSLNGKSLSEIMNTTTNKELRRVCVLMKRLSSVDKYISTYIDRLLKQQKDGRFYYTVDNYGTVTGRISGNLQQQPKEGIMSWVEDTIEEKKKSVELFHPRKAFVPDKDFYWTSIDFSQQEMRIGADFTIKYGLGDINMCRAYMPYKCLSLVTGEEFDPTSKEHEKRIAVGEWVLKEDTSKLWEPVDLHTVTTAEAIPSFISDPNHPDYDEHEYERDRSYGKRTNFLKLYGGGVGALITEIGVSEELAKQLNRGFNNSFYNFVNMLKEIEKEMLLQGYTENAYGRKYFMLSQNNYYKLGNYKIQGSGSYMIKKAQIRCGKWLRENGCMSYLLMTIHDEIVFMIHKDELDEVISKMVEIMTDTRKEIPNVPMKVGVEISEYNWKDVESYKIRRD